MAWPDRVINEYEEELMIVIDELQKKINSCSLTIEDMSSNAHNYSLEIRKAGMRLHEFVEDGKYPPVPKFGVPFIRREEVPVPKHDEDCVIEVINVLYQATASIPNDLPWYVCACGADAGLYSCHSIIHDHTSSQIRFFIDYRRQQDILDGIQKIFECLHAANTKSSISQRLWIPFSLHAFEFFAQLTGLLKDVSDSWLRVKLALEQIVVKNRAEEHTYKEILVQLLDAEGVGYSLYPIDSSIESLCWSIMSDYKYILHTVLIIGVVSVMATYVGDSGLMEELKAIPSESMLFELILRISKKDGEWFDHNGKLKRRSNDGELQIWDSHVSVFLGELKEKMAVYDCFNQKIKEEMLIVIDKLDRNIRAFSETIEELCKHAQRYLLETKTTSYTISPESPTDTQIHQLGQPKRAVSRPRRYLD